MSYYLAGANSQFVVIHDDGQGLSVTNNAENVVREIAQSSIKLEARRLFYRDTDGQYDELLHNNGRFGGFKPGTIVERDIMLSIIR